MFATQNDSNKKRRHTKEDILAALVLLIAKSPNRHITTKALAGDLGLSEAALYRHFPSKAKMFSDLIDRIEASVLSFINQQASQETSSLSQLENILSLLIQYPQLQPGLVFLLCGESIVQEDKRLQERINLFYKKLITQFKQYLRMAVAENELSPSFDVENRADMLLSLLLGSWLRFAKGESSWNNKKVQKQFQLVLQSPA